MLLSIKGFTKQSGGCLGERRKPRDVCEFNSIFCWNLNTFYLPQWPVNTPLRVSLILDATAHVDLRQTSE